MGSKTEDTITYDKNTEEVVVRKKSRKIKAPFSAVGELTSDMEKHTDIFDLLNQVSKGALNLFTALKRSRNGDNNLVNYSTKGWSKTQKETFWRRLRELRKYNIVRNVQTRMVGQNPMRPYMLDRHTYMINPNLLKCWKYEEADLLWSQCKQ